MIELSDENLADLKAMQTYCLKKSIQYQGAAGADFHVMAQYLSWFFEEINNNLDQINEKNGKIVKLDAIHHTSK